MEEDAVSVSINEELSYSLVEIAEEMLGAETFEDRNENITTQIVITHELNKEHLEQSAQKFKDPFPVNEISKQSLSTPTILEKLQIAPDTSASVNNIGNRKKAEDQKQKEVNIPEPERNGAVIFEDGKITVKIKNKHVVADAGTKIVADAGTKIVADTVAKTVTKEKEKKEPQKRGRKSLQEIEAEADLIEVPDDEVLFQKQYYSISEVAKWFRVNTSLLRFWENEFEILKPKKNRKGDRLFRPEDVKNLKLIYHLLRERKYTIEGAKDYIKTNRKKADIQMQLTNTLQKFKSFLLDLKSNL
ncbi:MAG: MerR family transcriptional regulator [Segetibacter sp.]